MFYLSKVIGYWLQPSALLFLLLAAGAVLLYSRHRTAARGLVAAAAVLILVGGLLPLGTWLILPLEQRFARADLSGGDIAGIVVLGGGEDSRVAKGRNVQALNEAGERLTEGLALARRFPKATVVFTGGVAELLAPDVGGVGARRMVDEFGLNDAARVVIESQSRNTWENALLTKALVKPKPGERWLLVTSSFHMPRAIGAFRKAGFAVEPWPVDYRTAGGGDALRLSDSPAEGLRRLEAAVHEWIGLLAYWALGRTDALLPAPG